MRMRNVAVAVPALALLAACQQQQGGGEENVHDIMKNKVDANADELCEMPISLSLRMMIILRSW